jgi:site-specific recombinase XerD
MSQSSFSRQLTLADVLTAVAQADLPPARSRDLKSAIHTIAKALGRQPVEIAADPAKLRRSLQKLSAEALGISQGRLANARSLLLKGVDLVKPTMPGKQKNPLLPAWQRLIDAIDSQSGRIRVATLARWLSEQEIGPDTVQEADLSRYRDQLFANSLRSNPEGTWSGLVWQWNKAVRDVEGFPAIELYVESRRKAVTYPWATFPKSLEADTKAWTDWLEGKDVLSDGPPRPVKSSTAETRTYQIRYFASALVDAGIAPQSLKTLSDLVALSNFETGIRYLFARKENKRSSALGNMGGAMIAIARQWVLPKLNDDKSADATLKRMRFLVSKIDSQVRGLTDKNHERILQFEDQEQLLKLLNLPSRLKAEFMSGKHPKAQAIVLADVALAVELLTVTAIRIGNIHSIELEKHLRKYRNRYVLYFTETEVKNRQRLQFSLPDETCKLIDWYLKDVRPLRLKGVSDALFIGEDRISPKAKNTLSLQIKETIWDFTGLTVNPHLFRHVMAYAYLNENPGAYQVLRLIFGHKSVDTTVNSYSGAETKSAQAHFDRMVQTLREKSYASSLKRRGR